MASDERLQCGVGVDSFVIVVVVAHDEPAGVPASASSARRKRSGGVARHASTASIEMNRLSMMPMPPEKNATDGAAKGLDDLERNSAASTVSRCRRT